MVHLGPSHTCRHGVEGFMTTEMTISQKESASPTSAGVKASPINSVILNVPSLSTFEKPSPMTYLRVKNGENIA